MVFIICSEAEKITIQCYFFCTRGENVGKNQTSKKAK